MSEEERKSGDIRQPIVSVLGHVDHGKTQLLDSIRGSRVQVGEAGGITQHVGASAIPIETIKKICGELLDRFKIKILIPGLLFIDTPGHEAFTTLRKRGGSVADLAVLVVDINEGFQPQTDESLAFLREFKTPFVVAATKIDKIPGWNPKAGSFLENVKLQRDDVVKELDTKLYNIVSQLAERGINAERFDRVENFTKHVAVVPCSGLKGEGVPELLMVLTGLAQQFLSDQLRLSDQGKGTVLELKEVRGFGPTIDVIVYDGVVSKDDYVIIGGKEPVTAKIKALLRPRPLKELRVEKKFESVDEVKAAAGIKVAAAGIVDVIPGSPILFVKDEAELESAKQDVQKEVEEVEFSKDVQGVIVKADTLGSLEAIIKMMKAEDIPIRKAEVGRVNKQDVTEAQNVSDELRRVVLAFNTTIPEEISTLAKDLKIRIFQNDIVYRLLEEYKEWRYQRKERELEDKLDRALRPAKVKILDGCIFHVAKPCIVGVEVVAGYLKSGTPLRIEGGKFVGKVKQIQKEGKNIDAANVGDRVAISMDEPTAGRQVNEGDVLITALRFEDKKLLRELKAKLTQSENELLDTI